MKNNFRVPIALVLLMLVLVACAPVKPMPAKPKPVIKPVVPAIPPTAPKVILNESRPANLTKLTESQKQALKAEIATVKTQNQLLGEKIDTLIAYAQKKNDTMLLAKALELKKLYSGTGK